MKHRFTSAKSDGADATLVQPSNWNDVHGFSTRAVSTSVSLVITDDLVLATGGVGGITLTLPSVSANTYIPITIVRVDTAAGLVTVSGTGLSFVLVGQGDMVQVFTDGTNWQVLDTKGYGGKGTALLNFGAFPGENNASVAVTGQSEIVASSVVLARMFPADTADHLADEHVVEPIDIYAGNIVPGTGFTVYGINRTPNGDTTVYGNWNIAWSWF